jgi:hypothetical protein
MHWLFGLILWPCFFTFVTVAKYCMLLLHCSWNSVATRCVCCLFASLLMFQWVMTKDVNNVHIQED